MLKSIINVFPKLNRTLNVENLLATDFCS